MPTYFKPLRRKIGVATLVLACAFACWWVRSLSTVDDLELAITRTQHLIAVSESGRFTCSRRWYSGKNSPPVFWNERSRWSSVAVNPVEFSPLILKPIDPLTAANKSEWFGFVVARGELSFLTEGDANNRMQSRSLSFPYCFAVIPLTLLSAWLLLSKPRESKTIDPVADEE